MYTVTTPTIFGAYQNPFGGIGGNDSFTVFLSHFDGADAATSATDVSIGGVDSPHTITFAGNAQLDTAQLKFGTASILFDGTGDYVTMSDSADWAFGTGDFTIDFWIRPTGDGTIRQVMGQASSAPDDISVWIKLNASNLIDIQLNGSTTIVSSVTEVVSGAWYHVAVVRASGIAGIFINGILEDFVEFSDAIVNSTANFSIGRLGEYVDETYAGWLDEVRISKGIARWTANFTPPTQAYS